MATLKYKDGNEWKKVSIGGGGSTEEVYVGSGEPTDENVKVWIDPTGTPSQPSQPSAGVEVIDNLESDSTTAALSANQGRVLKEMIGQGGGTGGVRIYDIPQAVINATPSAPYALSQSEIDDFIAQGDFSNTIVRFINTEALSAQMYAESTLLSNGILTASFVISQNTIADSGDKVINITFTKYTVQIGVMDGQGIAAVIKRIASINI